MELEGLEHQKDWTPELDISKAHMKLESKGLRILSIHCVRALAS